MGERAITLTSGVGPARESTVFAKLSKDNWKPGDLTQLWANGRENEGLRVLCGLTQANGRSGCDGVLGYVLPWRPLLAPDVTDAEMHRLGWEIDLKPDPTAPRFVRVDPITVRYAEEDEEAELNLLAHAVVRILRFPDGWTKGDDNVWARSARAGQNQSRGRPGYRRSPGVGLGFNLGSSELPLRFQHPEQYPCLARCPKCRKPNVLEAVRLHVVKYYPNLGGTDRDWAPWMRDGGISIDAARRRTFVSQLDSFDHQLQRARVASQPDAHLKEMRHLVTRKASEGSLDVQIWRALDSWMNNTIVTDRHCQRFLKLWNAALIDDLDRPSSQWSAGTKMRTAVVLRTWCRKYGINW